MNKQKFFDSLRTNLYKSGLSQTAVDSLDVIIDECNKRAVPLSHVAYIMATAYHEATPALVSKTENLNYTTASRIRTVWPTRFKTDAAAQPYVKNPQKLANFVYGGRLGNDNNNDGWTYRGRGHIQTTGKVNYEKLSKVVGDDLVKNPDRALETKISIVSLIHGMISGMYTGKKLADYNLPSQFYDARAIVNADKSRKEGNSTVGKVIAGYANHFEAALKAAGYKGVVSGDVDKPTASFPDPVPSLTEKTDWISMIVKLIDAIVKIFKK